MSTKKEIESDIKRLRKARKTMEMDPRDSIAAYPRIDEKFRLKHSLNFDMFKTVIFEDRQENFWVGIHRWLVYFFIGFFTGTLAFGMNILEEELVE